MDIPHPQSHNTSYAMVLYSVHQKLRLYTLFCPGNARYSR